MTLTNSIQDVKPVQRIEIAKVGGIGWFVVKQDDARMTRSYSQPLRRRIDALIAAIQVSEEIGWKLTVA